MESENPAALTRECAGFSGKAKNSAVNHGDESHVILTEGLVLQDEKIWKGFLGRDIVSESNSCELYFEEKDIEAFAERLQRLYPSIRYVNRLMTHSWGQKVIRFYDPDGNLIEVGTPMA